MFRRKERSWVKEWHRGHIWGNKPTPSYLPPPPPPRPQKGPLPFSPYISPYTHNNPPPPEDPKELREPAKVPKPTDKQLEIAKAKGLPDDWAYKIEGESDREMEVHAEILLEEFLEDIRHELQPE